MMLRIDAYDDIQFIRRLHDHLDVDAVFSENPEYRRADPVAPRHISSDNRNQRKIPVDRDLRPERALDFRNDRMHMPCRLFFKHNDTDDVHAGRDMLDIDAVPLKYSQNLSQKADLARHMLFVNDKGNETLFAGDSRDRRALSGIPRDHGAVMLRLVGIADVDGDSAVLHRQNAVLMKHVRSHIGKLAQLLIGDASDRLRIFCKSRIRRINTGNIRPVLIDLRTQKSCEIGACDIRPAA